MGSERPIAARVRRTVNFAVGPLHSTVAVIAVAKVTLVRR